MLTESDIVSAVSAGARWNVIPDIHEEDFIFRYFYERKAYQTKDAAIHRYFELAEHSAQHLSKILSEYCKYDGTQRISLLEFASGYGAVTRHLRNVLPFVDLTACEIHSEAVTFLREKLKVRAIQSHSIPEQLVLPEKYDVVFALSFFSHMPKSTFSRWLTQLISFVKPGGCIIFTTHGLESRQFFPNFQFDESGFCFQPRSEQADLDTAEYGMTCVRPDYVFSLLREEPRNRLLYFQEGLWWKHQDVYAVRCE
jgi:SAM-dependent methyltransferase